MASTQTTARLAEIPLPDFGMPDTEPLLPTTIFAERLARLRSAIDARGYSHVIVLADREHSANLAFLYRLLGLSIPASLAEPIGRGTGHPELGGTMRRASEHYPA